MNDYLYFEPATVAEALQILGQYGPEARPMAGGTDLILDVLSRGERQAHIVSLQKIDEMIFIHGNGDLHIGAATTHHSIETSALVQAACPMLAEGVSYIGSRQIRNLATIGGNICNALPCADSVPPLVAAGAIMTVTGKDNARQVPVETFITGPRRTDLQPGELATEIVIPAPAPRTGNVYLVHTTRKALDLTIVGVAVQVTLEAGSEKIQDARIALANCSPAPMRARAAEQLLVGNVLTEELAQEAAEKTSDASKVRDSALRASAAYRKEILRILTRRALFEALHRAQAGSEG